MSADNETYEVPASGAFVYVTQDLTLRAVDTKQEIDAKMSEGGPWLEIIVSRAINPNEDSVRYVYEPLRIRKAAVRAYG